MTLDALRTVLLTCPAVLGPDPPQTLQHDNNDTHASVSVVLSALQLMLSLVQGGGGWPRTWACHDVS